VKRQTHYGGSSLRIEAYFQQVRNVIETSNVLILRYDNTGHHRKLNLSTFPHHKHEGSENNVVSSSAPVLAAYMLVVWKVLQLSVMWCIVPSDL